MKTLTPALAAGLLLVAPVSAQTPNTVFLDELTWMEVADKVDAGTTEVPPVAVPLPMLDPEPSVVPGVGAS